MVTLKVKHKLFSLMPNKLQDLIPLIFQITQCLVPLYQYLRLNNQKLSLHLLSSNFHLAYLSYKGHIHNILLQECAFSFHNQISTINQMLIQYPRHFHESILPACQHSLHMACTNKEYILIVLVKLSLRLPT